MEARIKFLGGVAGDITGSCYLLIVKEGKKSIKILVDAGLIQCGFNDSLEKNQEILKNFKPEDLDYVVLTHSHIDHVGRLPLFTKYGFKGRIICTKSTKNLLEPMLEDSANIQMMEATYFNKRMKNPLDCKGRSALTLGNYDRAKRKKSDQKSIKHYQPLYTINDVVSVLELVKNGGYDYHEWIRLSHNLSLKFYASGHVIGGAVVVLKINSKPKDIYLCFTGDLGRQDGIILPAPELVTEPIDYLVIESTYGGKIHPPREQEIKELLELIRLSAKKGKRIIIPSFALERSQEIIYLLSYYMEQGVIPEVPIYLDSPLGEKITRVFSEGWDLGMFSDQGKVKFNPFNPLENKYFKVISKKSESDNLIAQSGNYIVIAGSGMCDAGRVRGHLRANLSKSDTIVCLVGYMAENSLGRRLKDRLPIKMNGEEIDVRAEVISFNSFSAHADGPFLVDYAKGVLENSQDFPKNIFIVHGENQSAKDLKIDLEKCLPKRIANIIIPKVNDEELIT